MRSFIPDLDLQSNIPLYVQLYESIKGEILKGNITASEKLPSIRDLSKTLKLSKTTIESAYDQLLVEGYIYSKPQSGYYINLISLELMKRDLNKNSFSLETHDFSTDDERYTDASSFDFIKWKKCSNKILTEYTDTLLLEALPQGEALLRNEISKYVYQSRGVKCTSEQIIIGAGTQQNMHLVCNILENIDMDHVAFEDPGYYSARKIFLDRGFIISPISIDEDGMKVNELINSPCSVAYVSPSHQFPLGSVMSIGRRYELLEWASEENRIIIEDDYDSELRYYGRPIPSLQGLDEKEHVIYLGSFSSTLLPSIKISYIILPNELLKYYKSVMHHYNQTCSKIEQLTLGLYMKEGFYQKHIKKLRKLYATKAQYFKEWLQKEMDDLCKILNHPSGIHLLIEVRTKKTPDELCKEASKAKVTTVPLTNYMIRQLHTNHPVLLLYYTQIPLVDIPEAVKHLRDRWMRDLD
ncbi:MAG: PLP-dependent aminotransferase family protein [Clostridia bacterium]|nr:PLP-dependent aminotransferase family protein [Clostridia bacterium]